MAEQKLWEASEMLSPRIRRLRDYYFMGKEREFSSFPFVLWRIQHTFLI